MNPLEVQERLEELCGHGPDDAAVPDDKGLIKELVTHRASGALFSTRVTSSRVPWDVLAPHPDRVLLEQCRRVPILTLDMGFEHGSNGG